LIGHVVAGEVEAVGHAGGAHTGMVRPGAP
jgi:hypothetical protein